MIETELRGNGKRLSATLPLSGREQYLLLDPNMAQESGSKPIVAVPVNATV
jgi:hypothetical protein